MELPMRCATAVVAAAAACLLLASGSAAAGPVVAAQPSAVASAQSQSCSRSMGAWSGQHCRAGDRGLAPRTSWASQGLTGIGGIDISLWDHEGPGRLDLKKLSAAGARFVFIKASDGIASADATATRWWSIDSVAAADAGMLVGGYQYAQPAPVRLEENIVTDATRQATLMAGRMGTLPAGYLPPVLDLESAPSVLTATKLTLWANTWLQTVEQLTGRKPILYTYTNFAKTRLLADPALLSYPFWQAEYKPGVTVPTPIPGWPLGNRLFWQFSSQGHLPGSGGEATDLDEFMGTTAQLLALANLPATADVAAKYGLPTAGLTPATPAPTTPAAQPVKYQCKTVTSRYRGVRAAAKACIPASSSWTDRAGRRAKQKASAQARGIAIAKWRAARRSSR